MTVGVLTPRTILNILRAFLCKEYVDTDVQIGLDVSSFPVSITDRRINDIVEQATT